MDIMNRIIAKLMHSPISNQVFHWPSANLSEGSLTENTFIDKHAVIAMLEKSYQEERSTNMESGPLF